MVEASFAHSSSAEFIAFFRLIRDGLWGAGVILPWGVGAVCLCGNTVPIPRVLHQCENHCIKRSCDPISRLQILFPKSRYFFGGSMRLVYRGNHYETETAPMEVTGSSLFGTYRGQRFELISPRYVPAPQASINLSYRGVPYCKVPN
jgi:hypothetical protein